MNIKKRSTSCIPGEDECHLSGHILISIWLLTSWIGITLALATSHILAPGANRVWLNDSTDTESGTSDTGSWVWRSDLGVSASASAVAEKLESCKPITLGIVFLLEAGSLEAGARTVSYTLTSWSTFAHELVLGCLRSVEVIGLPDALVTVWAALIRAAWVRISATDDKMQKKLKAGPGGIQEYSSQLTS